MVSMHIIRDVFPQTDHGHTWIETVWFERDGDRISPLMPSGGYCDRLGSLPGGPLCRDINSEAEHYGFQPGGKVIRHPEKTHNGFHRVLSACVIPT